MAEPFL